MRTVIRAAVVFALILSGCATGGHGQPVGSATIGPVSTVGRQVAFDHDCPVERIRLIRIQAPTVDLDVCGSVRRYKSVANGEPSGPPYTWLDVTNAYPPSAIPAPLPP